MTEWQDISTAPRDGTEIMLFYHEWCGQIGMVVSGHWFEEDGRGFESTWEHSFGYGDADMWQPLPSPPNKA